MSDQNSSREVFKDFSACANMQVSEILSSSSLLKERISAVLRDLVTPHSVEESFNQITLTVEEKDYKSALLMLRDHDFFLFDTLIDLCGVDYQDYGGANHRNSKRFAIVVHLLSVQLNQRIRVRVFCQDPAIPTVDSLTDVWPVSAWFEREAFDLFGILFRGNPDLRRILTDYGFSGHPFRKDFPVSGYVEVRYDENLKRVIYQPVSIEPREVVPRIVREPGYGGTAPRG